MLDCKSMRGSSWISGGMSRSRDDSLRTPHTIPPRRREVLHYPAKDQLCVGGKLAPLSSRFCVYGSGGGDEHFFLIMK